MSTVQVLGRCQMAATQQLHGSCMADVTSRLVEIYHGQLAAVSARSSSLLMLWRLPCLHAAQCHVPAAPP
jgi:hypothetical protein